MPPITRLTVVPLFLLALSLALLVAVPPAAAQSQTCDHLISAPGSNTVGITISAHGTYCLATDVIMAASFTTGTAITINANYVTLDLNGHMVHGGAAGSATQAIGISAGARRGITVKNGHVWGFQYGVYLAAAVATPAGNVVDGIHAERNTVVGIAVGGTNNIVRNCIVAYTGSSALDSNPRGILLNGHGARAVNNDVLSVRKLDAFATGIYSTEGRDTLIVGNRITDVRGFTGLAIHFENGSTGKFRDNLTSGIQTQPVFSGGTDAGNNN
jgi:hypothetical protein